MIQLTLYTIRYARVSIARGADILELKRLEGEMARY